GVDRVASRVDEPVGEAPRRPGDVDEVEPPPWPERCAYLGNVGATDINRCPVVLVDPVGPAPTVVADTDLDRPHLPCHTYEIEVVRRLDWGRDPPRRCLVRMRGARRGDSSRRHPL